MIMRVHYRMLSLSGSGAVCRQYALYSVSSGHFACRCGRPMVYFSSTKGVECSVTVPLSTRSRELMAAL